MMVEDALRAAGWTIHRGDVLPVVVENTFPITLSASGEVDCELANDPAAGWVWDDAYPGDNIIAWKASS